MPENTYVETFFYWFTKRFKDEAYRKMGVSDIAEWAGGDPSKDLVLVINGRTGLIEVESNYFKHARAYFDIAEIEIRFERYLRGV